MNRHFIIFFGCWESRSGTWSCVCGSSIMPCRSRSWSFDALLSFLNWILMLIIESKSPLYFKKCKVQKFWFFLWWKKFESTPYFLIESSWLLAHWLVDLFLSTFCRCLGGGRWCCCACRQVIRFSSKYLGCFLTEFLNYINRIVFLLLVFLKFKFSN